MHLQMRAVVLRPPLTWKRRIASGWEEKRDWEALKPSSPRWESEKGVWAHPTPTCAAIMTITASSWIV